LTVMVIVPVWAILGLAGVILNSVSVKLTGVADELLEADAAAAGAELLVVLLACPQPANRTAATMGANTAARLIADLQSLEF